MDDHNLSLADYYDLLDATFPVATMPSDLREAALQEFTDFVRSKKLSISEAAYILKDQRSTEELKAKVKQAASKVDAPSQSQTTAQKEVVEVITRFGSDLDFIKGAVVDFTKISHKTVDLMLGIEKSVAETNVRTADSKKSLEEINAAAAYLQEVLTQAADKTNIIVEKMETIPPRLDAQLQKIEGLEKGVEAAEKNSGEAKRNTDPGETWKQGLKLMWHSVAWGTVASTLCGAGVGAIITHYSTKAVQPKPEPEKEAIIERVIEREVFPKMLILRDKTGKIVYTLEVAPQKESPSAVGSVHTPSNDTYAPKSEKPTQKKRKVPNLLYR